jgi:uncharacterized protein (DUF305 family)
MIVQSMRQTLMRVCVLAAAFGVAACSTATSSSTTSGGATVVIPGRPGEASRVQPAGQPAAPPAHTADDVAFMQGMIHHHAQALDMTALLYTRSESDGMKLLARRIDVSQSDEIKFMRQWLADRGADVPGEHAHHMPNAPKMPGMLTADDMARLAAAKGLDFDRLFLQFMIKHHEGALQMVKDLFAKAGAGQEATIFAFASDVVADQQIEIDRMRQMLGGGRV